MSYYTRDAYLPSIHRTVDWEFTPTRMINARRPTSTPMRYDIAGERGVGDCRECRWWDSGVPEPTTLYPRPPSPGYSRKQMMDLEDQLRMHKDELSKKEKLIEEMTSFGRSQQGSPFIEPSKPICSVCRHDNRSSSKSEMSVLQAKVESLESQVNEMENQLKSREEKIRELKIVYESSKDTENRDRMIDETSDSMTNRSEAAVAILQREIKEAERRIFELESELRVQSEETEKLAEDRGRVEELSRENSKLQSELKSTKNHLEKSEAEKKSNNEKTNRLSSELEKARQNAADRCTDVDRAKSELDGSVGKHKKLENEITVLAERLESSHAALSAARGELEKHMRHCGGLDRERRHQENFARTVELESGSFREALAIAISKGWKKIEATEERIKNAVEDVLFAVGEKAAHVEKLEMKNAALKEKLDAERQINVELNERSKHGSRGITDLEARLRQAEKELMGRDVIREGLQSDKEKFWHYLTRLCRSLEMDDVTVDLGLEGAVVAIVARVEQVMKKDVQMLTSLKTQNRQLQLQIRRMKDQLESKETHIELLRRKVTSLEDRLSGGGTNFGERVEHVKDDDFSRNRKMQQLIEKYRHELNECHVEIRELKSRLMYSSDMGSRTLGRDRELEELEREVGELEHERMRQESKIVGMENVMRSASDEILEKKEIANNTILALSSELRTAKAALNEVVKREKQLLELRLVIARMLGLDVSTLVVPDYEVVSRLEKLVLANQANGTTAVRLDRAIADLQDGFQAGYQEAGRSLSANTRRGARSRSLSPRRKFDRKTY